MGRSRTSGIITDEDGNKVVNKVYQGRRIFRRLGAVSQQEAEQWLARQTEERRKAREFGTRPERNFADAAEKYLIERAHKASIDTDALHITALLPFIGKRPLRQIHDATLEPFKAQRRRDGVSETTIKRALEVVRCILNLAARSWRDEHGLTWLETAPLITMPDTRSDGPQTVSAVMGRATPAVCVVARLGGTDGALRRQHRLPRARGVSAALEVGSAGSGIADVGVRDPRRIWRPLGALRCQEPRGSRGGAKRRGQAGDRRAAWVASRSSCSLPAKASRASRSAT